MAEEGFRVLLKGYYPCHNQEELWKRSDTIRKPILRIRPDRSFAHGAGFVVNWDQVEEYMHVESGWNAPAGQETKPEKPVTAKNWKEENEKYLATEKELEEIFERTPTIRSGNLRRNRRPAGV